MAHLFFVDAAHFVMGSFLCCVWCLVRLVIRGASGRKRYSVLEAWNAATNALVSVTTDATVNAETLCALLRQIAALGLTGPVRLVLDNARYQHCALVMDLAKSLNIECLCSSLLRAVTQCHCGSRCHSFAIHCSIKRLEQG